MSTAKNSILALRGNYNSDGDSSGSDFDQSALIDVPDHLNPEYGVNNTCMDIVAAPIVITKYDINAGRQVDTSKGKISFFIKFCDQVVT